MDSIHKPGMTVSRDSAAQTMTEFLGRTLKKRDVASETCQVAPSSTSKAVSSHKALCYHLISPHVIRRLARRLTDGAAKYGSVQWRMGINDGEYIQDRYNHFWEHLLKFQESGNTLDDNLGAMLWALHCLVEVEQLAPESFKQFIGVCGLFGEEAERYHLAEKEKRSKNSG